MWDILLINMDSPALDAIRASCQGTRMADVAPCGLGPMAARRITCLQFNLGKAPTPNRYATECRAGYGGGWIAA